MTAVKDAGAGYLLLRKPSGITSFQALFQVKKAFSTPKVGHTGTLDKFASGLLLVLVGRAVKLSPWFSGCDKRYEGTVCFGAETDTLDGEGSVIAEAPPPSGEALEAALDQFRGDILQAPPAYSAVHLEGERAHRLARAGAAPEMPRRPVTIYSLELRSYEPPLAHIAVHCSKGTYIRSLARDIALAAGSRAYLSALSRTRIAAFSLEDAAALPDTASPASLAALREALKPPDAACFKSLGLFCFTAAEEAAREILRGKALDPLIREGKIRLPPEAENIPPEGLSAGVFREDGSLAAIIRGQEGPPRWTYGYVYARD
jgi:tRNA pseudouridine55 synthase